MIYLKSSNEIANMRKAGRIVAETLAKIEEVIRPGITTKELDRIAEDYIRSCGARPSFKGYYGFPATLCTSINEQVVHGIPGDVVLKEGDIISVDCGAFFEGFHGDAARTFPVGRITPEAQKLIDVTRESFFEGLKKAVIGNRIGDISHAIQTFVEEKGMSVVRDYVGHGIGKEMHEEPPVPNFGKAGRGPKLAKGMTLAIEPMVNLGTYAVDELNDGWTVITYDGKLSAHYENTIVILENGPEILTMI
ncbi:methionine aminopeptidase [Fervidicella metallireducens AeB]|uniref:Methionine aminopeptidase n=1 Tax=Fervidicella metallireducens AeB TaxID=1403537 RepID=A0A017RSY1_9CLOT|nr:type I methionyl aminopeptidase [Fervidicella metallireducens]EYE87716.1 methionine aminopeptidase [Fervidicella metallireducens AeB]